MATLENWLQQPSSHLGGQQASEARTTTKLDANVEAGEGLRHNLSKLKLSSPFSIPFNITSKALQPAGPSPPRSIAPDSGYGAAPSSASSMQDVPLPGLALPGTELRYFDKPIPERLSARFFDIKVLYTQPLLDAISKRRKDPGDISMKLKHLGLSAQSIELHIVIQCDRRVARKVKKFFAQEHVEEDLLPDFRVLVLERTLLRLANDNAIEVLVESLPEKTMCGMPIEVRRGHRSVSCTLGGVIMIKNPERRLYGLMAGHPLKRLQASSSGRQSMTGTSESSSDEEYSDSGDDSVATSVTSSTSRHFDVKKELFDLGYTKLSIGTIAHDTFTTPLRNNYDWALVELNQEYALPNMVVPNQQSQASDFEAPETEIHSYDPSSLEIDLTKQVLVLRQGESLMAELSFNTSSLMISPGSRFVDVYDITMKDSSSLHPGDSGSWVVDAKTRGLYGHVISVDAFGEAQVMPIHSTLRSIREQLKADRVFLPPSREVDRLKKQSSSTQERLLGLQSELASASTKRRGKVSPQDDNTYKTPSEIVGEVDKNDASARDLYLTSLVLQARGPNTAFCDICTELRSLHRSLNHLRTEALDQESILDLTPFSMQISGILELCDSTLATGRSILNLYDGYDVPFDSNRAELFVSERNILAISVSAKITNVKTMIDSVLNIKQLNQTRNTDRGRLDTKGIKVMVDEIASRLIKNQDIQPYWGDKDDIWEQFQAHLQNEGFSSRVLHENRSILRAYVREILNTVPTAGSHNDTIRSLLEQPQTKGFDESQDPNHNKSPGDDSEGPIDWMEIVSTQDLVALDDAERLMVHRLLSTGDAAQLTSSPPPYTQHQSQDPGHTLMPNLLLPRERDFKTYADSEWTVIARELVSVEVLERACVRYEARPDFVAVLGRLSREQAEEFVRESKVARAARNARAETGDGLGDQRTEVSHNRTSTRSDEDSTKTDYTLKAVGASSPEMPVEASYTNPNSYGISKSKERWKDLREKTVFGGAQQKSQLRQGGIEETHKKPLTGSTAAASLLNVLAEAAEFL